MIDTSEARRAHRGLASIAFAKIFFIVAGYGIQLVLPRIWTEREYGSFAAVMVTVSMLNNVLIATTIQSVSRFISQDGYSTYACVRRGLSIQFVLGLVLSGSFFLLAPIISSVLNDERLTGLLQVVASVLFSYALYATFVGALNGMQRFQEQARLDITFSVLRTTAILGTAALGWSVAGAVSGFAAAAFSIFLVAFLSLAPQLLHAEDQRDRAQAAPTLGTWLAFLGPIGLYQVFLNGTLQVDLLVLKKTVAELGLLAGMGLEAAANRADELVGRYRAAQTFAFVPYQLMLSMTLIVFPRISRATANGDRATVRSTIKGALRFSLLVLLAIAAPISGAADGVLLVAFPKSYVALGAPALSVLIFGLVAFALFVIHATVLSGSGRAGTAACIAALAFVVVLVTTRLFILAKDGMPGEMLRATAFGTVLGMTVALIISAGKVYSVFRTGIPIGSLLRASIAAGMAHFVSSAVPHPTRIGAFLALAAGALTYGAGLIALRELRLGDWYALRDSLRSRTPKFESR
ncbi:MAG: oligosaccharide flippase family protein [Myxococcota bacterium]